MYILYEPNNFCFKSKLKEELWSETSIKNHLWKFHYVFTQLVNDTEFYHPTKNFIKWHFTKYNKILSNSEIHGKNARFATLIIDYLVRWKILIRSRTNKAEFKNDGFLVQFSTDVEVKFYDEFIENGWREWHDDTVKHTYHKYTAETLDNPVSKPLTGIYKELADNLPLVKIDALRAKEYTDKALKDKLPLRTKTKNHKVLKNRVMNDKSHAAWLSTINSIDRGNYCPRMDENKTGRFFSRLTSTPSDLRQFLTINGKPCVETDISNSQCLVFAGYLKKLYTDNNLTMETDIKRFIQETETGVFYQNAMKLLISEDEVISYQDFKVSFFARVFFSSGTKNYKVVERFKVSYPNVYKHIARYKTENGHKALPVDMQKIESDLMLHQVCKQLFKDGITEFFTVHDAIYCTAEHRSRVKEVITEVFIAYGVTPHMKSK